MAGGYASSSGSKRRVFEILEIGAHGDWTARFVNGGIVALILVNITSVVLETVPELAARRGHVFVAIEVVTVLVFVVEFVLRLWVADLHAPLSRYGPWGARLRYLGQPATVVDFLAVGPTLVALLVSASDVNVFVIFRLLRFLKLARYSPGLGSLVNAVHSERRALLASGVIMGGLIVSSATLMYLIERDVQPDRFGSIPSAMYWAVTTMTTVGYGDVVPLTPAGRALAGLSMLVGFCMFALPVGIIATAFAREIHQRDFVVTWAMVARVPLFADLGAAEIADITKLLSAQSVEPGTVVTRAGDPAHSMYFIVSGTVEVDLPAGKTRLSDGAFFGEVAVLRKATRSADVVAVTACRLMLLDSADLHVLLARKPDVARRLRAVAEQRLAAETITPKGDIVTEEIDEGERRARSGPDLTT